VIKIDEYTLPISRPYPAILPLGSRLIRHMGFGISFFLV